MTHAVEGRCGAAAMSRRTLLGAATALAAGALVGCADERGGTASAQMVGVRRVVQRRGEWWLPAGDGTAATVVLVHGGYWQPGYDRHLEDPVAADLASRGYVVWNIDYSPATARWPATLRDAAAAYDQLAIGAGAPRVDRSRVAVVGHSAGGQLALWLASRYHLPNGAPGATPGDWVRPRVAVGQAPVAALRVAADEGLGGGAVLALCGGNPGQQPGRYRIADPSALVPAVCPVHLIHGRDDDIVPISQSQRYRHAARRAGADVSLTLVTGGHFTHLDPTSSACQRLRVALADALGHA